jgi:hypothetical protein
MVVATDAVAPVSYALFGAMLRRNHLTVTDLALRTNVRLVAERDHGPAGVI